tara:strand:- start:1 stop:594 length:594 start_codon:yes stop_codon:yes gene_type:complete
MILIGMNRSRLFLTIFFLVSIFVIASCSPANVAGGVSIQVSTCNARPDTPISEASIDRTFPNRNTNFFAANRSQDGNVVIHDLEANCFISISTVEGGRLEILTSDVRSFVQQSEEYKKVVQAVEGKFLRECSETDRFESEIELIFEEMIASNMSGSLLPCEILLDRMALSLIFKLRDSGPIGGILYIDQEITVWSLR